MLIEVALDVGLVRELGGGLDAAADRHGGWAASGRAGGARRFPGLPEVDIAPLAAPSSVAELQVPAPLAVGEQQLRPNRVPTAIWSLLRSLLFRGAVKRLDTSRNR